MPKALHRTAIPLRFVCAGECQCYGLQEPIGNRSALGEPKGQELLA
jgi:hypothetical protein